jgi:formylglycine-generating enzyme required for sulfatase activity
MGIRKLCVVLFVFLASGVFAQQRPIPANFVRVEGGTFQMGSNESNGQPVHTVTITGFYMGRYEVTQKEWTVVMGNNPSQSKGDNLPVERVSWFDSVEYCNRLSQREGLTPAYTISGSGDRRTVTWNRNANGYRLPTEAEWEYAVRGGNGSPGNYIYSGSNTVDEVAWYGGNGNSGSRTQNVGTKNPNGLGLYDMSGNVSEWCWDWFRSYESGAQTDPIEASSAGYFRDVYRVLRGGSWLHPAGYARSTHRDMMDPSADMHNTIGFRLVRP